MPANNEDVLNKIENFINENNDIKQSKAQAMGLTHLGYGVYANKQDKTFKWDDSKNDFIPTNIKGAKIGSKFTNKFGSFGEQDHIEMAKKLRNKEIKTDDFINYMLRTHLKVGDEFKPAMSDNTIKIKKINDKSVTSIHYSPSGKEEPVKWSYNEIQVPENIKSKMSEYLKMAKEELSNEVKDYGSFVNSYAKQSDKSPAEVMRLWKEAESEFDAKYKNSGANFGEEEKNIEVEKMLARKLGLDYHTGKKINESLNEGLKQFKKSKAKSLGLKHIGYDIYKNSDGKTFKWYDTRYDFVSIKPMEHPHGRKDWEAYVDDTGSLMVWSEKEGKLLKNTTSHYIQDRKSGKFWKNPDHRSIIEESLDEAETPWSKKAHKKAMDKINSPRSIELRKIEMKAKGIVHVAFNFYKNSQGEHFYWDGDRFVKTQKPSYIKESTDILDKINQLLLVESEEIRKGLVKSMGLEHLAYNRYKDKNGTVYFWDDKTNKMNKFVSKSGEMIKNVVNKMLAKGHEPIVEVPKRNYDENEDEKGRKVSWFVTDKATGQAVRELFDGKLARNVNLTKYNVETSYEYLGRINSFLKEDGEDSVKAAKAKAMGLKHQAYNVYKKGTGEVFVWDEKKKDFISKDIVHVGKKDVPVIKNFKHAEKQVLSVWDNGGETLDRYSVVLKSMATDKYHDILGVGSSPNSYSQFDSGQPGRHLGKKIDLLDLPMDVLKHVVSRLTND